MNMPLPELPSDNYRLAIPRRQAWKGVGLVVLSLLPTGAAGGLTLSARGMSEKLEALVTQQSRLERELDLMKAAGTSERVRELEERQRHAEEQIAATRAIVEQLSREKGR